MKLYSIILLLSVISLFTSTSYAYPLDYLEEDFVYPEETEVEWFISGIIAEVPRTVAFSEVEDNDNDETKLTCVWFDQKGRQAATFSEDTFQLDE